MSSVLNMGRQAPKLHWQIAMPNLLGSAAEWEAWIKGAMKEARGNSPLSFQPQAMAWVAEAFKLTGSSDLLWHVPAELVAFDNSLAMHLDKLMKEAPGPAGK